MKQKIRLQLDTDSIDSAIREVKTYQNRLKMMYDIMCRKLIAEGVQFA